MAAYIKPFRRLLNRLLSTRRGSMLILVIVILVLLALLGTALISTSRIDRLGTQQNAVNTQVDMLLESVKNLAKAAVSTPLYGGTGTKPFRPPVPASDTSYLAQYHNWVSYGPNAVAPAPADSVYSYDAFLASRIPNYDSATTNVIWPFITTFLANSSFESPYTAGPSPLYTARTQMPIGYVTIGGLTFPAFAGAGNVYLAADADGDGEADSGLFKLPVGTLNGVTYYAGVRIIDNGSAINASTAWYGASDFTFTPSALTNVGMFQSNVGLTEFLADFKTGTSYGATTPWSAEMNKFNGYRFNSGAASPTAQNSPIDDTATARNDFTFYSQGDALQSQLARRLKNPGYRTATLAYKSLTSSDAVALAYRYCLVNPNGSPSNIEALATGLPSSLYISTAATAPTNQFHPQVHIPGYYSPSTASATGPKQWWYDQFDWENKYNGYSNPRPLRSILVASNGASNQIAAHNMTGLAGYVTSTPALPATIETVPFSELMPNYSTTPGPVAKASVNTAPFNILWRAFWNVMVDSDAVSGASSNTAPPQAPITTVLTNTADGWGMFRNVLRDPSATPTMKMTSQEVMMLRSAIAAVNTIDLRDNDFNVSSRHVTICGAGTSTPKYEVTVFGNEPQPFITEIYANTDTVTGGAVNNPKGYVAVELYNPYPYAISLDKWQLGIINRHPAPVGPYPALTVTALTGFTGFSALPVIPVIAPGGYITLENYNATPLAPGDAKSRPTEVQTGINLATAFYVPGLQDVLQDPADPTKPGGELVLLRPRRAQFIGGVAGTSPPTLRCDALTHTQVTGQKYSYDEANLNDLVPADSFDFTNLALPTAAVLPAGEYYHAIHYIRASGVSNPWKFVYPGKYTVGTIAGSPDTTLRQEGTDAANNYTVHWGGDSGVLADQWTTAGLKFTFGTTEATASSYNSNTFPGIQWANQDAAGWNMTSTYPNGTQNGIAASPLSPCVPGSVGYDGTSLKFQNQFPFGQFARNGDMLQIPFIGAYTIRTAGSTGGPFIEMNSVSMDSSFADDQDAADDAVEAIGRFCPIWGLNPAYELDGTLDTADTDKYRWAKDLFDYLTVNAPGDDYLPNVDSNISDTTLYNLKYSASVTESGFRYPYDLMTPAQVAPVPIANTGTTGSTPLTLTEETVPVEGLININTASWKVLSAIPFTPTAGAGATAAEQANNVAIAKLIVDWRDGTDLSNDGGGWTGTPHGPFKSIYDLNRVVLKSNPAKGFQNAFGTTPMPFATDPVNQQGDMSPYSGTRVGLTHNPGTPAQAVNVPDGIRNDFEERFLILDRVSNLVTTRSDLFTVYIVLQGWRNVGTNSPELVVQRRAAMIVDRNALTTSPTGAAGTLNVTNVPTD